MMAYVERRRFTVTGVVQGVGFRPFVHRLATELELTGFVGNDARAVFAEVQGPHDTVEEFAKRLAEDAPPLALITGIRTEAMKDQPDDGFRIVPSTSGKGHRTLVSPDVATCDDCLRELFGKDDRRYRHPFITCTNCGPRFTIIQDLPYDRPNTTMASFPMCESCAAEYQDPANRRFHAQPIACHDCGPTLRLDGATGDQALTQAQRILNEGGIVAVKGIGGYHLACRADDEHAVAALRERKAREGKPFALLTRDLTTAGELVTISDAESKTLTSPARPIVLLRRRARATVAASVAPGNPLLGVLLPYAPVHHLLLTGLTSLVFTSANISDEPLCYTDDDERTRLPGLADAILTHDRPIHVPCDDSVVRIYETGSQLPVRRSRGYAPLPVALAPAASGTPAVLAVGAELKNSCCLTAGGSAFCSAHIGDMGNVETLKAFEKAVSQLTTLHKTTPDIIAADLHPAYLTRDWAENHAGEEGEPELRLVQHHHAHVASLLAEHGRLGERVIGFAFDGTGYGTDGTIWGGEILLASGATAERAGHLRPVPLPGGDATVRNPCRMALAYLTAADVPWTAALPPVSETTSSERSLLTAQLSPAWAPVACTSMGRLFDAVSALIGVRQRISYEAQAAIELEILAEQADDPPDHAGWLPAGDDGEIDYRPLIQALASAVRHGARPAALARAFHESVADAVTASAERIANAHGMRVTGLTGGVFQNVLLTRLCRERLEAAGFEVLTHRLVPPNDGGLALGQAAIVLTTSRPTPPRSHPTSASPNA